MKKLTKGARFNVLGSWFNELDEILDINGTHALVKCHNDLGENYFAHLVNRNDNWESFIIGQSIDGLLYDFAG